MFIDINLNNIYFDHLIFFFLGYTCAMYKEALLQMG